MQMKFKRIASVLLALVLLVSLAALPDYAGLKACAAEETVTLIAGSDLQNSESEFANTQAILEQIKKDTQNADGFLACGDYDIGYLDMAGTQGKINTLSQTVIDSGVVAEDAQMVYVQGNHDLETGIGTALANTGDNDPENGKYGVFVLNYRDTKTLDAAKASAEQLRVYLNEKLEAGYSKPVFILAHAPLHYSMRVYTHGEFPGAEYIFNVLNDAGEKGLNIFFLFGHNHSTWDHYLGGGSIYLPKGDTIMIAPRDDTSTYRNHQLNFTYMNAGYLGYYSDGAVAGTDCTLTMTKLEITGSDVTITRYSADGVHNLKSAGVNNHYRDEYYPPNRLVYASPQTVALTAVSDQSPIEKIQIRSAALTLSGVLGINVKAELAGENPAQYSVDVTVDGKLQTVSQYQAENGLYVYTADLLIQDLHQDVSIALKKGAEVVDEKTFRYSDYQQKLVQMYPKDTALQTLTEALRAYGSYAAYFADSSSELITVPSVEAVIAADLAEYQYTATATKEAAALKTSVSLFLDTACDLRVKFDAAAFEGCTLTVNGSGVSADTLKTENGQIIWEARELLPQQWADVYSLTVSRDGTQLMELKCSALSYAYMALNAAREQQAGLNGLMKAMYLYSKAAWAYQNPQEPVYVQVSKTVLDKTASSTVTADLPEDTAVANVYSGGYATTGITGNVDLSKYTELKFYVKTASADKYFELFAADGIRLLALHKQEWEEVKLVREGTTWALYLDNKWRADGLPGDTLNTLFSKVTLGGSAVADVYVTDLVGIDPDYIPPEAPEEPPVETVYETVSGQPFDINGTESTETLEGYDSVTELTTSWNKYGFKSFDLTNYIKVKFAVKSAGYYGLMNGDTVIHETRNGGEWLTIELVKNGESWEIYYGETLEATVTLPGNDLSDLNFRFGDNTYYVTNLMGVADPGYRPLVYTTVSESFFALTGTESTETLEGYDSVTAFATSWNQYNFNNLDLLPYLKVKFAVKSTGYYGLMYGGTVIHETTNGGNWMEIELVRNGTAWEVYYGGILEATVTLPGNNLTDLHFRFGSNTYHVTELKGIADPDYSYQSPYTQVATNMLGKSPTSTSKESLPSADVSVINVYNCNWVSPGLADGIYMENYTELKFYYKVSDAEKWFEMYGPGNETLLQGHATEWTEVKFLLENGTWTLYVGGVWKKDNLTGTTLKDIVPTLTLGGGVTADVYVTDLIGKPIS